MNERTMLKCIFKKKDDRAWNGFTWFKAGTGSNVKLQHPRCVRYNKKGQVMESIHN